MPKYAQIVMGPAGSGKSTYCAIMQQHLTTLKRPHSVVNCDPAAENFSYECHVDVKEIIDLDDAMEYVDLGPNGGLVFCMDHIVKNMEEENGLIDMLDARDGDYFIFDFPGQIELYTHLNIMRRFVDKLQKLDFRVCGLFLVDAHMLGEPFKFLSGVFASLSCMVNLEIPYVSLMTKMDMLPQSSKNRIEEFLETKNLLEFCEEEERRNRGRGKGKFIKLTRTICNLVDDYGMVTFMPVDQSDMDTVDGVLQNVDMIMQVDDDRDVRVQDENLPDE